jgi:hypothetical protein
MNLLLRFMIDLCPWIVSHLLEEVAGEEASEAEEEGAFVDEVVEDPSLVGLDQTRSMSSVEARPPSGRAPSEIMPHHILKIPEAAHGIAGMMICLTGQRLYLLQSLGLVDTRVLQISLRRLQAWLNPADQMTVKEPLLQQTFLAGIAMSNARCQKSPRDPAHYHLPHEENLRVSC